MSETLLSGRLLHSYLSSCALSEVFKRDNLVRSKGLHSLVLSCAFLADKHGTLATECLSFVSRVCALLTLHLYLAMDSLQPRQVGLEAVNKESCFEFLHTSLWEAGLLATFWTRERLVGGSLLGQFEDALFAVIVETREDLRLCVVFLTDSTSDLLL